MSRIGFRTAGFAAWPIERALRALAAIGYASVELCLERLELTPARCQDIAGLLGETGLRLSALSYHGDGRPPQERAEASALAVEAAARMRCPILILNTMRAEPGLRRDQMEEAVILGRRLLDHAPEVALAYEPEPGLVIATTDDMLEFMERMASPRIAVNLDIGHAHITEPSAADAVQRLGTKIAHTHIEDIAGRQHRHLVPGAGEIDFAGVRAALDGVGYRGDYTVDMFDLGADPQDTARRCLEAMRRWFA